jgi:large subunit ribosomal protein L9
MMEIILLERIANLGQMGDLVTVKPGYARNFLLPQGKALRATKANRERFDNDRAQLEAENLNRKGEAEKIAEKMNDLSVSLIRAASEMGQLYGSASARDISDVISESGFTVNRNQIDLNTAIKTLGLFPVRVVLHPEVAVEVTVNIARSADEAAEQIKLGRAIVSDVAERERMEAAEAAKAAEQRMADFEAEEVQDTTGSDVSAETEAPTEAPNEAEDQADAGDASPDETSA